MTASNRFSYLRRLKAFRVTHTYRNAVTHISLEILQPCGADQAAYGCVFARGSRCSGLPGGDSGEKVRRSIRGALSAPKISSRILPLNLGR